MNSIKMSMVICSRINISGNKDRNSEDRITAEAENPSGSGKYSSLAIYSYGPIRINISDAGGGNDRSDTNLAYFTEHGNELIFLDTHIIVINNKKHRGGE